MKFSFWQQQDFYNNFCFMQIKNGAIEVVDKNYFANQKGIDTGSHY